MAKTKNAIKMQSSAGTGTFYVTKKNLKKSTEKLKLRKYDPKVRKHVDFVETKLTSGKKK